MKRFSSYSVNQKCDSAQLTKSLASYLKMFVTVRSFVDERPLLLIGLVHGFVTIAPKIASGGRAVLLPSIKTHPAKIVLAFGTLHMITAFVLLYGRLAARARFTVGD
jgi:hypothetical protein